MKTIKEVLVFKNDFAEAYNNEVIDFNGNKSEYFVLSGISSHMKNSVCILPVNGKNEIYIHQEYRYGIQGYVYTIPCGGAEDHLSLIENAKKELLEEANLRSNNLKQSNIKPFNEPSIKNNRVNYFIARNCKKINGKYSEPTEDFKNGHWIDITILYNLINKGEIQLTAICLPIILNYYIEFVLNNNH